MRADAARRPRRGFTLVEILVVITIILLVAIIAIPQTYKALNGRQVTDAARVFTGALAGVRDSAIKANEPRGLRLLPDPVRTIPAPGLAGAGETQLVYNRMVPIEPAGDYTEGRINIGPTFPQSMIQTGFPPAYPRGGGVYPFPWTDPAAPPSVLMVEESPFVGGFTGFAPIAPNAPTNWYWNIRVGDKIKINGTGRSYTVVGPVTISPWGTGANQGNYELYVNVGVPGTISPLLRTYYTTNATTNPPTFTLNARRNPEFLFLVNGEDDNADGYVDSGWNGYNDNPPWGGPPASMPPTYIGDLVTDNLLEWEMEKWAGAIGSTIADTGAAAGETPTDTWLALNWQQGVHDAPYTILRRPVPTQSAREIPLPGGIVIDATTWNTTQERSRLPVTPSSLYCDIMLNPTGPYIPTTIYSTPASAGEESFVHFWLAEAQDVYPRGVLWGTGAGGVPNPNPNAPQTYELPMSNDALGLNAGNIVSGPGFYPPAAAALAPVLKGERRLVTLFKQSGNIVTNTIEAIAPPNAFLPGEGFYVNDVGYPFRKAQVGQREMK